MSNKTDALSLGARLYVGTVIAAGVLAVLHSLLGLISSPVTYHWFILAGLTLLSGSFTVRIPTIPARLSVSETFVFAAVLLFGTAAATLIVVLDTLVISLWLGQRSRRPSRVLFNMAAPAVAIYIASSVFYALAGITPLSSSPRAILSLLVPLVVLAVLYFLLNSFLIAWAVAFERRTSALQVWRQNFLWLSLNYFSGASVAALLLPYLRSDYDEFAKVIGVLLPLLLISYLTFKTALGRVDDANRHLSELNRLYLSTIETLAMAIDAKDQITHGHIRRVQTSAVKLAQAVGVTDPGQIRAIEAAALLHDMGKLAVPEYILNKPGPLTPAEFDKMKLHASVGADILSAIDFPYPVVPIVRHHHENWDGSGYPDGLAGADIPIGARVLSVVDCFDALTSDRPYRPRLPDTEALRILLDRRGRMYDPLVVDTFVRIHSDLFLDHEQINARLVSFSAFATAGSVAQMEAQPGGALDDISSSSEETLVLLGLARSLSDQSQSSDVADVIFGHLRRLIPFVCAALYTYQPDSDDLLLSYSVGEHPAVEPGLRIALGQRLTGWVGANRQSIRNSDPILDLGEASRGYSPRLRSALSAPLLMNDSLVGVISLYSSSKDAFSDRHQRVLEIVALQVASVLDRARAAEQALDSPIDGVPGLVLERDQLSSLVQHSNRITGEQVTILYVGLEWPEAKSADRKRHQTETFLRTINTLLTQNDTLFRYSSHEFVIVSRAGDVHHLNDVLRRLKLLESSPPGGVEPANPTLTLAIAASPQDGETIDALVAGARVRHSTNRASESGNNRPESVH